MTIELNLAADAKFYDLLYGASASSSSDHGDNFGCFKENIASMAVTVNMTLDALKRMEEVRTTSFVQRMKRTVERAVQLSISTIVSVISLLSSVGSSVYFTYQINEINFYVDQITLQQNDNFEKTLSENIKILYNDSTVTAVRTNVLMKRLQNHRNINACSFKNLFMKEEQARLGRKLDDMTTDIATGRLMPNLLPVEEVKTLVSASQALRNSIYKKDPLILYRVSSVSLLSVDKAKKKITFLLVFPLVNGEPSFVRLNPLIPTTTLKTSTNHYHRIFTRISAQTVAVPINSLKRSNFDLSKLSSNDFLNARITLDRTVITQWEVCKSFPVVDFNLAL